MYCEKCGKEIVGSAQFCEHCGNPVPHQGKFSVTSMLKNALTFAKTNKILTIGCVVGVLVVFLAFGIINTVANTIDPADYIEIKLSGFNSRGRMSYSFDPDDELLYKLVGINGDATDNLTRDQKRELLRGEYVLKDAIDVSFEEEQDLDGTLSNGDSFVLKITVDTEALEQYGYRFAKEEYDITYVIGKDTDKLPEPATIDFFAYLDIQITGFDQYGILTGKDSENVIPLENPVDDIGAVRVSSRLTFDSDKEAMMYISLLSYDNEVLDSVRIKIEATKIEQLAMGDEVTVTLCDIDRLESCGIFAATNEKTYIAEALEKPTEIDLLRYIKPIYSGINGSGKMEWNDGKYTVELPESVKGIEKMTVLIESDYWSDDVYIYPTITLEGADEPITGKITGYVNKNSKLSNGDEITIGIKDERYSNETIKKLNSTGLLFATQKTQVVAGLVEPVELNILAHLPYAFKQGTNGKYTLAFGDKITVPLEHEVFGITEVVVSATTTAYRYYSDHEVVVSFTYNHKDGGRAEANIKIDLSVSKYKDLAAGTEITLSLDSSDLKELAKCAINVPTLKTTVTVKENDSSST